MTSLIWQSWPRITLTDSQRLLKHFETLGTVISFKSTKKAQIGSLGQGIVVFQEPEVAAKLLGDKDTATHDLREVFERVSAATDTAQVEKLDKSVEEASHKEGGSRQTRSSQWNVSVKRIDKTPVEMSLDSQLVRRKLKSVKESALLEQYLKQKMPHIKAFTPEFAPHIDEIVSETKAKVEELFSRRNQARRSARPENTDR